jgi:hypothetical protein
MIGERIQILILDNEGKAALMEHPAAFPLPERKIISTKGDEPLFYFKTNRTRHVNGKDAVIYTQKNFNKNLDDFATGYVEDAPGIAPAIEPEKKNTDNDNPNFPISSPDDNTHFSLTIKQNADGNYEAHMGVGSEFNRDFMDSCGDDVLEEFMGDLMADLRLKAKKKSKGYIQDTTELES